MESIEPYNFADAVDFQTAYLSGYLADKYDVTVEQSVERANARVKKSTEQAFAATVQGYATVTPESCSGSPCKRQGKVCAVSGVAAQYHLGGAALYLCHERADG